MRLLGIDFGLKKLGLAIAEESLAQPLGVIRPPPAALEEIAKICTANRIEKIVIGLPEGEIVDKVKIFAKKLSARTNLPLDFQDETLTTQEVVVKMRESGRSRKLRRLMEDAFAATLILQNYLDERRKHV